MNCTGQYFFIVLLIFDYVKNRGEFGMFFHVQIMSFSCKKKTKRVIVEYEKAIDSFLKKSN